MTYSYPDEGDNVTNAMIRSKEPYAGYWAESEERLLERIRSDVIKLTNKQRFLDVGSGSGRLLPLFAPLFQSTVAVDADSSRLDLAKNLMSAYSNITFINTLIEDFSTESKFDFILCSHLLQHVSTNIAWGILHALTKVLAPSGKIAVLTNKTSRSNDFFTIEGVNSGVLVEREVDQQTFNGCTQNKAGWLPVHYFSHVSLSSLVEQCRLRVVDQYAFHCLENLGEIDHHIFRDIVINGFPELQTHIGRDIYLLLTPQDERL